ncbi:phospholipase D-like domain-containing protein [Candidatus Protochlamydia phocaeensis]|uniref:phospholipase D-like domain-containing protein n=1 Tax=Candidatus Protochlamydia phocaeensis TaxID=1414722 RepID=UPI0008381A07|nr:phosphatidylserine/phosphatidylglycerophosphate/cardiolipin synthase family protein [Candidatus Protochlamydia phocaeensis]
MMSKYLQGIARFIICVSCLVGSLYGTMPASAASVVISSEQSQARFYHTQDRKQLRSAILEALDQAQKSILIFTFSLSDPSIIAKLKEKALQGIQVTVVIDHEHLNEIKSKGSEQIEIATRQLGQGHLHHKILVVDRQDIWIGSANFTRAAYEGQENLMVRLSSSELGAYLANEADVFKGKAWRFEHGPLSIPQPNQIIDFCLLPHESFPIKKIEAAINAASKERLLNAFEEAQASLKIAMMVWTSPELAQAAIQAHQRGVRVQVVAPDLGGVLPQLQKAGIEVKINPALAFVHNKMMIVDDTKLVNGSANWSKSAFTRNDESFIVIHPLTDDQQEILHAYWNYLWPVD